MYANMLIAPYYFPASTVAPRHAATSIRTACGKTAQKPEIGTRI
jgi:hypothetical protein